MNLIPFGEVKKDRYEISVKYKLIEKVAGIYRLTKKCRDNYDPDEYVMYLQGKIRKPKRISKPSVKEELKSEEFQQIVNEILSM